VVHRSETVTLDFTQPGNPSTLQVTHSDPPKYADDGTLEAPAANPSRFGINLTPGDYMLYVFAKWHDSDGYWSFGVRVV
jgi:hypothetical protein